MFTLSNFPSEIRQTIFLHVNPSDLQNLGFVDKATREVSRDRNIWKSMLERPGMITEEPSLDDQLIEACKNRNLDKVIILIFAGANVNCQTETTRLGPHYYPQSRITPLHIAVHQLQITAKSMHIVDTLLRHGADDKSRAYFYSPEHLGTEVRRDVTPFSKTILSLSSEDIEQLPAEYRQRITDDNVVNHVPKNVAYWPKPEMLPELKRINTINNLIDNPIKKSFLNLFDDTILNKDIKNTMIPEILKSTVIKNFVFEKPPLFQLSSISAADIMKKLLKEPL